MSLLQDMGAESTGALPVRVSRDEDLAASPGRGTVPRAEGVCASVGRGCNGPARLRPRRKATSPPGRSWGPGALPRLWRPDTRKPTWGDVTNPGTASHAGPVPFETPVRGRRPRVPVFMVLPSCDKHESLPVCVGGFKAAVSFPFKMSRVLTAAPLLCACPPIQPLRPRCEAGAQQCR